MTVDLAAFNEWRVSVEARLARLEALYFTRNEHSAVVHDQDPNGGNERKQS